MLRIVDFSVKFLYSVLLSAGALAALVFAPPVGIVMLLLLRRYLRRVAESDQRPRLHIRLY
jgi:hypothetical protein